MNRTPRRELPTVHLLTLKEIVDHFESLVVSGELEAARAMFSREGLAIWFGLPHDRLASALDTLVNADPQRIDLVYAIHMFTQSDRGDRSLDPQSAQAIAQDPHQAAIFHAVHLFGLRMAGRPSEALELMKTQSQQIATIQPFIDARNGWPLFGALQRGFTAMLAGDNQHALTAFAEARLRPHISALSFLSKDVWAKSALLHAAWGDPVEARSCLKKAQAYSDSGSWAEDAINVHIELAEVLLETDPSRAYTRLKTVDMQSVGELWPFYVYTVFRTYQFVGARSEVEHQLSQLQSLPFPRQAQQGFSGSVFQTALATHRLFAGRGQDAKETLSTADKSIATTRLAEALIELYTGNPRRALTVASGLRSELQGLRQLEITRLSIEATAHLALSDEQAALASLKQALELPRSLTRGEVNMFPRDVRELATQHLPDWPSSDGATAIFDSIPAPALHLTDRELHVLRFLAQDLTRAEIAEKSFLSVNTVKTQLTSLYRKLGATSREEAILEAGRLGLL